MYNLNKKSGYKKFFLIFMLSFMFVFSRFNNAFCINESIDNNTDSTTGTSMKSISATATNDDNVTIEITTDKDNYSLRDTAKLAVKLTNKNKYSVFVCDLKFGDDLPDYIVEQIKAELPEKIDAAEDETNPKIINTTVNLDLGFSSFKTVKVGNEDIKVGILASLDVVPINAKFNVESIDSSHSNYETHLKNLDDQSNMQRVTFFDLTLKENNNEGSELITKFNGYVKVYIQVPNGWDAEELQALFVSTGKDEEFVETLETVDNVEYLTFTTSHFSPYALYDPEELTELGLTSDDINNSSNNDNDIDESYKTGHSDLKTILVLTGVAVVSLIIALMFSNKFRKTMLCLGIFFGLMGQALVNDSSISYAAESTTSNSNMNIKLEAIGKSGSYTEDVTVTLSFNTATYYVTAEETHNTNCWAYFNPDNFDPDDSADNGSKADVFFVAPTLYSGTDNMSMSNATTKQLLSGAIAIQKGIYGYDSSNSSDDTIKRRFFAPYYRQAGLQTYTATGGTASNLNIAYSDVKDAFMSYLDYIGYSDDSSSINGDYPIILAGFSQGADMCLRLLKDEAFKKFFNENLVACYAIGWRYTEDDNKKSGFSIADNEDGIGRIICFNTESADVKTSSMVPSGTKSYCINPINWSNGNYDSSTDIDDNKSISTFYNGTSIDPITNLESISKYIKTATIDETRGTLKLTFDTDSDYHTDIQKVIEGYTASLGTQEGVYHALDYQFFYGNLKQNVVKRLKKFLETD